MPRLRGHLEITGNDASSRVLRALLHRPLSSDEIENVLCSILSHVTSIPDETWRPAFAATLNALYGWCSPADVDAALVIAARRFPGVVAARA